jgi:hypothetical protein
MTNPNPDEIFSSPPIINKIHLFKAGFKYMEFTYNSNIDNNRTGKTEYIITLDKNYKYFVDILVVGGGGGKNNISNSGGGGGTIVYCPDNILIPGTYKIIVGNGGTEGTNGYDSMITFENNNIIILDNIEVKGKGGVSNVTSEKGASKGSTFNIIGLNEKYSIGGDGVETTSENNRPGNGGNNSYIKGNPGIVIISYRSEKQILHNNKQLFCKVEDSNKNKYILTDKFKQPLQCLNKECLILDIKKALDIKENISLNDFLINTNIECKKIQDSNDTEPINISKINFDNYNIASINKNIVIKNRNNEELTEKQIENNYSEIYSIDKNNFVKDSDTQNDLMYEDIYLKLKKDYDYKQNIFIEEDITKVNTKVNTNTNTFINTIINTNTYLYISVAVFILFIFIYFIYYINS